ncbi:MAG TPA: glycosyltransferase [Terracidiphilus sp.]
MTSPIQPEVSVVLAVHNGLSMLPRKIRHLLSLDYRGIKEVIIVSDGSSDGTEEYLATQDDRRLKCIILGKHSGKAVAVNTGIQAASAEIILFVDIRPEIAPGAIQQLVSNFADPSVGCANGELIVRCGDGSGASAAIGGAYWSYEKWIRTSESKSGSAVGVYGGFYAIRRSLAVSQPAGLILDDMFQPLSIRRQGFRVVLDPKAYVYDAWPQTVGRELHRKVRTLAGNFQLFQIAPWTLTWRNPLLFRLISHKVMRLFVPYLFVAAVVCTFLLSPTSHFYAALAAIQMLGIVLASVGLRYDVPVLHRVASPMSAVFVLNAAAVLGLYKFLFTRGPLWTIWKSSHSSNVTLHPGAAGSSSGPAAQSNQSE